jgi:AraC-like DNA-binding protein
VKLEHLPSIKQPDVSVGRGSKMDLALLSKHAVSHRQALAFDDWTSSLQTICGRYQPQRFEHQSVVTGHVGVLQAGGIDVAHIANNLGEVRREADDIRKDFGENLFLLIQLEGSCGIEQKGRQDVVSPGDCILIDSTRPSVFHFGGHYSNHISVHLPRQLLFTKTTQSLEVSRRLSSHDPMSVMLGSLVAKLIEVEPQDKRTPHLQQLLFDATRQAFATQEEIDVLPSSASTDGRLEIVQILIDRHLTDEQLTPRWLAEKLGVSLRTLQDDFNGYGTTPTSMIRLRRLHLAKDQLLLHKGQNGKLNIAELALSSGFNDISYFNRCFREVFHCTPKDMLHEDKH